MVILEGFIVVPVGDLEAVLAALPQHIHLTRMEPGCLKFEVVQRAGAPGTFDVHEEFTDQAAFEAHQARIRGTEWERCTARAERHYTLRS